MRSRLLGYTMSQRNRTHEEAARHVSGRALGPVPQLALHQLARIGAARIFMRVEDSGMTARFGFCWSLAACVFALAYGVPQLLQVAGILRFPIDEILIFAPSLLLAPSFVLANVGLYESTPAGRRVFALAALALAVHYAVLVSIVYVVQLGVVIPTRIAGGGPLASLFGCCGHGMPLTAVDLLGYTLMSVSTLFAAAAIVGDRPLWLALVANGLLAPFLILQLAWPGLIWIDALWLVTFPLAMALLAAHFRRSA